MVVNVIKINFSGSNSHFFPLFFLKLPKNSTLTNIISDDESDDNRHKNDDKEEELMTTTIDANDDLLSHHHVICIFLCRKIIGFSFRQKPCSSSALGCNREWFHCPIIW
jgi:hypothetical protein